MPILRLHLDLDQFKNEACEPKIVLTWIINHKNMASKLILCVLELSS